MTFKAKRLIATANRQFPRSAGHLSLIFPRSHNNFATLAYHTLALSLRSCQCPSRRGKKIKRKRKTNKMQLAMKMKPHKGRGRVKRKCKPFVR